MHKRNRTWLLTYVVLTTMSVATMSVAARAAQVPPSLVPLLADKDTIAADLARQIGMCSSRKDSKEPMFKGCVDWHSAVHGIWALVAYERATGDHQYSQLVSSILTKPAVQRERDRLHRTPSFEMPYGRAWFLRLVMEHNSLTGSSNLLEMGDEVSLSVRDYYRQNKVDPFSGSYESASWALMNLFDYARYRNFGDLQAEVEGWITKYFVSRDMKCPSDKESGEFMAVCTNWAALVSRALDEEAYSRWLEKFIEINGLPTPVTSPISPHHFGLNFSRAWGLWDIYDKTGRSDVIEAYAAHFDRGFKPSSNWKGSYSNVGHWVAQFGMFALQPLFGPRAGR